MMIRKASLFILCNILSLLCFSQEWEIIPNEVTGIENGLSDIVFVNDSTGLAVGGWGFGAGVIIKTTDYGQSWTRTDVDRNLFQICFAADSVAYAVGEGTTVMKTEDLGESWTYQNTSSVVPDFWASTVAFLNKDTGFVGLENGPGYAFLSTYDGGVNWQSVTQDTVRTRTRLQAINDSTIIAAGFSKLSITENSGQSWSHFPYPDGHNSPSAMHFFNKDQGLVAVREFTLDCGSHHYILHTENGGQSWETDYYPCSRFRDFTFPSSEIGFALGFGAISESRYMRRTFDSGQTWEELEYPVGEIHYDVSCSGRAMDCVNQDTCYIATNYGTIIKMTNASVVNVKDYENESSSSNITIYPNPNSGNFTVSQVFSGETIRTIKLISTKGQEVFELSNSSGDRVIDISVNNLRPGMYLLLAITEEGIICEKVVIE